MQGKKVIGVFDSGLGGLTVVRAIKKRFPKEAIVYLGDTARVPYGMRSADTIIRYALNNIKRMAQFAPLKLLVVACNTASAVALKPIEEAVSFPVIGVIEPVVRNICRSGFGSIVILGTRRTVESNVYEYSLRNFGFKGKIQQLACQLFVPLVEEGLIDGPVTKKVVEYYLEQCSLDVEAVVLGCTHFPLLLPALKKHLRDGIAFIESGDFVACEIEKYLAGNARNGAEEVHDQFLVTDAPHRFSQFSEYFLGRPVPESSVQWVDV